MDFLTIKGIIKEYIKLIYICPNFRTILNNLNNTDGKIILFGTPAHGNLGDHAIAISELDFLKKTCERLVVEVPMPLYKTHRNRIKKLIDEKDVIIISGGGWMGNLWIHNEITIREIVLDYPKNKVVIFPQTLYYTDDEYGNSVLNETSKILLGHSKLYLTVREQNSYICAKERMGFIGEKNLFFCPDMVAYGTLAMRKNDETPQKRVLLCMRDDIEKKVNDESIEALSAMQGYSITKISTVLSRLVPLKKRKLVVSNKLAEFQNASLVVTDRLHAMLFAVLSGTPCIVFDNVTGKVLGVGTYLQKNGANIQFSEKLSSDDIEKVSKRRNTYTLSRELSRHFDKLADIVRSNENENS